MTLFVVWTHGKADLKAFVDVINCQHPTIKFTTTWSEKEVTFLDTQV